MLSETQARQAIDRLDQAYRDLGLRVSMSGKRRVIVVRGVFPPKPGKSKPSQIRLSLGISAHTRELISQAEKLIALIHYQLKTGEFSWSNFEESEPPAQLETYQDFAAQWKNEWWQGKSPGDSSAQETWRQLSCYIKALPDGPVTIEGLIAFIGPESSGRRTRHQIARAIAQLAGHDPTVLDPYRSKLTARPVNPRELPTDDQLLLVRQVVADCCKAHWLEVYDRLLFFGLRNHEVWFSEAEGDLMLVPPNSKTGSHTAIALSPITASPHGLTPPAAPQNWQPSNIRPDLPLSTLGDRVVTFFGRVLRGKLQVNLPEIPKLDAYDMRHRYAARGIELEIPDEAMANFMGHSVTVHRINYRAWIDQRQYQDVARRHIQQFKSAQIL